MPVEQRLNLDIGAFLADHWQRKPLLIKNAIPHFVPPVSSDELAGLALEADVESRIIEQRGKTWRLQHGPFTASDFARKHPWTLLVQAVDHYVPAVAELFQLIDFIPRWRTDDIMVSYAVDGGGVGPHFDSYDVFLLQGEGQRLWRLGQHCDSDTRLLPHDELRILHTFDVVEEHLLGPGDMLYVPPGIAHWGIAQGEGTTFSLGLRAPRTSDMLSRWTEQLLLQLDPQQFFTDAGRKPAARPGELAQDDIDRALAQLREVLARPVDNRWFGELVTEPRYDIELHPKPLARARALLRKGPQSIELSAAAKLAWQHDAGGLTVYTNGESVSCGAEVLPTLLLLCESRCLHGAQLDSALANADTAQLLDKLLQSGCIDVQ
jgi:50S ribosomal protein L16 3-hydroxylase